MVQSFIHLFGLLFSASVAYFLVIILGCWFFIKSHANKRNKDTTIHWTEKARQFSVIRSLWTFAVSYWLVLLVISDALFMSPSVNYQASEAVARLTFLIIFYFLISSIFSKIIISRYGIKTNFKNRLQIHLVFPYIPIWILGLGFSSSIASLSVWLLLIIFTLTPWYFDLLAKFGVLKKFDPETRDKLEVGGDQFRQIDFYKTKAGMANAFALAHANIIVMGAVLEKELTLRQQASILKHEIAHLSMSKFQTLSRVILTILPFVVAIACLLLGMEDSLAKTLGFILTVFLSILFTRAVGEKEEQRADSHVKSCFDDNSDYAYALEKVCQINLIPAVTNTKVKSHPDLYDRFLALDIKPAYDKPKPPDRHSALILVTLFSAILLAGLVAYFLQ